MRIEDDRRVIDESAVVRVFGLSLGMADNMREYNNGGIMIRSILPVGQGAFYCERFDGEKEDLRFFNDKLNVVYDCGSLTDCRIVKKEICDYFDKDEIIDGVFISHLDDDHINGIPFLLKYCDVKKVFFPLISKNDIIYNQIGHDINNSSNFTRAFLSNPQRAINDIVGLDKNTLAIGIREGLNLDVVTGFQGEEHDSGVNDVLESDGKCVKDSEGNFNWLYTPFNFKNESRIDKLKTELNKEFGREINNKDLETIWRSGSKDDKNRVKDAYKRIPGNLNTNSMVLYSGSSIDNVWQIMHCSNTKGYWSCPQTNVEASGCLYTGDYDASGVDKFNELVSAYKTVWNNIGLMQIPHHGSRYSFNKEILQTNCHFFVSAGYSNRYRHPHSSVIREFLFRGIFLHIVCEFSGSRLFSVVR